MHTYGLENPVRTGFTGAITLARTLERMMPVRVLIAVLIVLFVCLLAAPEGVAAFTTAHANVPVFTGAIDRQLDSHGYIRPGLGDAGDRFYGTR